jgi:hypothetical protein
MATLDEIQAQLSARITRAAEARMLSTRTGPGQDSESTATLADETEVRLMLPASPTAGDEVLATCTQLLQEEESMPTLTDEIKTFIVKGLACYDTPSQVAEAVKVHFNVEVTRQHVYAYDPNASQHMSPRWSELYAATRQALLRELGEIGIAHRAVRLRRLDRLASRCERNSVALAITCLREAAKECGGMYENRKPIILQPTLPQPAMPEPLPQHAAIRAAPPQHAATRHATPQPAAPQPAATQPATPQPSAPPPSAPSPVMQQPSLPERAAPQAAAPQPQAAPPQPTPQKRPTPLLSMPLPVMPQPDMPAPAAPLPLAVLAQAPQPPALPEARPLTREERYRAYVRDRHARDRAVRAQALLDGGRISAVPPAS